MRDFNGLKGDLIGLGAVKVEPPNDLVDVGAGRGADAAGAPELPYSPEEQAQAAALVTRLWPHFKQPG